MKLDFKTHVKEVTATASQRWRRIYLRYAFVRDAVAQAPCIILNADDVSGPAPSPPCLFNERAAPLSRGEQVASARKFVARVASELPSALLSLGWTTRGEGGRYAEEDVDAMDAVVGAAAG